MHEDLDTLIVIKQSQPTYLIAVTALLEYLNFCTILASSYIPCEFNCDTARILTEKHPIIPKLFLIPFATIYIPIIILA